MDCKHETKDLLGTADGILCRRCGRLFPTYEEYKQAIAAPGEKPKKAKKKKEADK